MRRPAHVIAFALLIALSVVPVQGDEPAHLNDGFVSVEVNGDPLIPTMSSFRWVRGRNGFQFELWTLADTPWILPLPLFNFFEIGVQLKYFPVVRSNTAVGIGIGTAFELVGVAIAVPLYLSVEWQQQVANGVWSGLQFEGLIWQNGGGAELYVPVTWYSQGRFFASLRAGAIAYFVEDSAHINFKTGLEMGLRKER